VFSNKLPSSARKGHSIFNITKSRNYRPIKGSSWSIGYYDGSGASGTGGLVPVQIGGVKVNSQAIEVATKVSSGFASDTGCDGLLGLGFKNINQLAPKQGTPFFFRALPNLAAPVFTATLKHGVPGTYDFGVINKKKYTGSITYAKVDNSSGYWAWTSPKYKIGTTTYSSSQRSIADTGTSLILLTEASVTKYYKALKGAIYSHVQGGWIFPCTTTPPSFSIGITGSKFLKVPGKYMNYAPVGGGCKSRLPPLQALKSIWCTFSDRD
jgi:aspergillopepsin I